MPATEMIVFDCSAPAAPVPMARFALRDNGDARLVYGRRYLERKDAFSIDPRHLALQADEAAIPRQPDGTFGAISDAGPNAWGARLTARLLRKQGQPLPQTPVEWFLQSRHFGSGCLAFSPSPQEAPHIGEVASRAVDLSARLLDALDRYVSEPDPELDEATVNLLFPGSDLGGLRPKTVVLQDGVEHIAKFRRPDDLFDVPAAEFATLKLAHLAGIDVPSFELVEIGGRSVLLVERFDRREDGGRIHYLSAHSLLRPAQPGADGRDYKTSYSYAGIAELLRPLSDRAQADAHELFRRMVLNIMVGNVDDHLRNHALLMHEPGVFRLSPVFDICPHLEAPYHPQTIGVGAFGRAGTIENALSQCGRFYLTPAEAAAIVSDVRDVVVNWRQVFAEAGVGENDRYRLAACFSVAEQAGRVQVNLHP